MLKLFYELMTYTMFLTFYLTWLSYHAGIVSYFDSVEEFSKYWRHSILAKFNIVALTFGSLCVMYFIFNIAATILSIRPISDMLIFSAILAFATYCFYAVTTVIMMLTAHYPFTLIYFLWPVTAFIWLFFLLIYG